MATMTVERNGKVIGAIVGGLRLVPVRVRECEHDCDGPIPGSGWKAWAIVANGPKQRESFYDDAEHWEDLEAGTFAGTNVRAALVVLVK